ncbi:MAG TPA: hypothetical protein DFS52_21540 [Myxococcales bacterium]|jgi:hypothetical protein|nr:hypothetical protein [Myxococcales bacterium]
MKDRVGSNNPSPETIEEVRGGIRTAAKKCEPFTQPLSTEERSQALKMRPNGEWIVELMATLATRYGVSLPGISVEGMRNDLALANQLQPVEAETAALAQTLSDTILTARSECWWAALAYYTTLVRIADSDPVLADALKPAIDYFATGKRKSRKSE